MLNDVPSSTSAKFMSGVIDYYPLSDRILIPIFQSVDNMEGSIKIITLDTRSKHDLDFQIARFRGFGFLGWYQ